MSSPLPALLARYAALSAVQQRAVAAILGAAAGDAATRPFHWLYDAAKLAEIVGDKEPEFWPESHSPFYTLPTGRRSCYNDEGVAMLFSLPKGAAASPAAAFDAGAVIASLQDMFSPTSEYAEALKLRAIEWAPERREMKHNPVPGPWQHSDITYFLGAVAKGEAVTGSPTSLDTDPFANSMPLIAKLAAVFSGPESDAAVLDVARSAASVLSSNEVATARALAAGVILRRAIVSGDASSAGILESLSSAGIAGTSEDAAAVASWLEAAPARDDIIRQYKEFGWTCANPGNFKNALLTIFTATDYVSAVRQNLMAGGCQCSRINFAGAVLGAVYGIGTERGIPVEWIERTHRGADILEAAINTVA